MCTSLLAGLTVDLYAPMPRHCDIVTKLYPLALRVWIANGSTSYLHRKEESASVAGNI